MLIKRQYSLTLITFSKILSKFPSRVLFLFEIFLINSNQRQHWLTLIVQLRKFHQFLSKAQMVQIMLSFPRCLAPFHQGTTRLDPYHSYKDDVQISINSFYIILLGFINFYRKDMRFLCLRCS